MNHLSSRVISLVLAVIFLFSAAGISFATLFRGTTVYAEEGDTAGTTTQVESQAPKEEPDAVLNVTPRDGDGSNSDDKTDPTSDAYNIQGVQFLRDGKRLTQLTNGDHAKMVITVVDTRFTHDQYDALVAGKDPYDFFAFSINTDVFRINNLPGDHPDFFVGSSSNEKGVYYTITYPDITYTGESKTLRLSVSYPPAWGIGMTDFSKELNELKVKSPSSEREHNKNDDDDDDSSSRPDIAPPTPTLIVSEFDYGGAERGRGPATSPSSCVLPTRAKSSRSTTLSSRSRCPRRSPSRAPPTPSTLKRCRASRRSSARSRCRSSRARNRSPRDQARLCL